MVAASTVRRARWALALGALVLLLAACGDGGEAPRPEATPVEPVEGRIEVSAFEWGFEPEVIAVEAGEQVELILLNDGNILHNWKVDEDIAQVIESQSSGPLEGQEGSLFVGADGGQSGVLVFVPEEPGEYVFYCTIDRHRALGMEGVLIVR